MPYNEHLEHAVLPSAEKLVAAVKRFVTPKNFESCTSMPEIQMPKLSDTMSEGTLSRGRKKKGDQVSAGESSLKSKQTRRRWNGSQPRTGRSLNLRRGRRQGKCRR